MPPIRSPRATKGARPGPTTAAPAGKPKREIPQKSEKTDFPKTGTAWTSQDETILWDYVNRRIALGKAINYKALERILGRTSQSLRIRMLKLRDINAAHTSTLTQLGSSTVSDALAAPNASAASDASTAPEAVPPSKLTIAQGSATALPPQQPSSAAQPISSSSTFQSSSMMLPQPQPSLSAILAPQVGRSLALPSFMASPDHVLPKLSPSELLAKLPKSPLEHDSMESKSSLKQYVPVTEPLAKPPTPPSSDTSVEQMTPPDPASAKSEAAAKAPIPRSKSAPPTYITLPIRAKPSSAVADTSSSETASETFDRLRSCSELLVIADDGEQERKRLHLQEYWRQQAVIFDPRCFQPCADWPDEQVMACRDAASSED